MVLWCLVFLSVLSLSTCQSDVSGSSCFSSRDCRGDLVSGGGVEVSGCCVPGGGLSFRNDVDTPCQECYSAGAFENEGSKFYFGLFGNFQPPPRIVINRVRLYVNPAVGDQSSFTLTAAGTSTTHTAPTEISMDADQVSIQDDNVRDGAIVIESDEPLSIVGYAEEFTSSDTFKMLPCVFLPVTVYEYYSISVPLARIPLPEDSEYEYEYEFEEPLGNSAIVITTTEKDTELTISLTQSVIITAQDLLQQVPGGQFDVGVPVTLRFPDAAQTLAIASLGDLTGSRILSNKPIVLISGHECGTIPNDFQYCDHLLEQVPPTATWGRTFVTCPIAGRRAYDIFKVLASSDNSVVDIFCTNGRPPQVLQLQRGEFTDFNVSSSTYCYVSSNRPVLLVQYSIVSSVDNVFAGDPFMVIVPPVEQYRSSYSINTLSTSFSGLPEEYFVNILLPGGVSPAGLRMNGDPLSEAVSFISVPCGNRAGFCGSSAQVNISSGQHTLTHENSSVVFDAIVYWLSFRVGSGYFAGMTQNPIALPRITLASGTFVVFENQTSVAITITRSGNLCDAGSFHLKTLQLSMETAALAMEDFEGVDEDFGFLPNQTEVVVPIAILNDVFPEEAEQFEVILTASPGVFIDSPAGATVTILNDDPDLPVMNVSFADVSIEVAEGVGVVKFLLLKTAGALGPVSVQIATQDGTAADGGDYVAINQTVTFEIEDVEKEIQTTILDNSAVERVEQFTVFLTPLVGVFPVAVQDSLAVVSITDNDVAVIGFSVCELFVIEDSEPIEISIQLLHGTIEESVEVLVTSFDRTAENGSDYLVVMQDLTFGESLPIIQQVAPVIVADDLVEDEESFGLTLEILGGDAINVQILQNQVIVNIMDIDEAVIMLQGVETAPREGGSNARLNIGVLQGGRLSRRVAVRLLTVNVDATAEQDFTSINQTIDITGSATEEVLIEIIDDSIYEGTTNEQFMVIASLEGDTFNGRVRLNPNSVVISIEDNDPRPRAIIGFRDAGGGIIANEGDAEVIIVVTSDGFNQEAVSVQYSIRSGSAQEGQDINIGSASGTLTFPPGSRVEFIIVSILDDSVVEAEEQFVLQLGAADNQAVTITGGAVEVTITDDDAIEFSFEQESYSTSEGGDVTVVVRKFGEVNETLCVMVNSRSGTALEMMDFMPPPNEICFAPSVDIGEVRVSIVADDISETPSGELFLLQLSGQPAAYPVQVTFDNILSVTTITIVEDRIILPSIPMGLQCSATVSTITCTWSQVDTVTNYLITWLYTGPCDRDTQSFLLSGQDRNHTLRDLEEGGMFQIMLYAMNSAGRGPTVIFIVSTDSIAPSAPPQFVRSTVLSGSSARIQWNEVNCLDANGLIEQYVVSYALSGGDGERLIRSTTSRMLVISELVAGQQYSVQVAAENSVGRGPFSDQISVILLDTEICESRNDNCDPNAACISTPGSFICLCNSGYSGDGVTCSDLDECAEGTNTCSCNADCSNTMGSFTCSCMSGFIGDGFTCSSLSVQFQFPMYIFTEGDQNVAIVAILSIPAEVDLTVTFTPADGTANAGDYDRTVQTVTFLAGQSNTSIPLSITDDFIDEDIETFMASLTNPSGGLVLGDRNVVSITIIDNDEVTLGFSPASYEINEADGEVILVVEVLSGILERSLTVLFETRPGQATERQTPVDYDRTTLLLSFSASMLSVSVRVVIVNDAIVEGDETFFGFLDNQRQSVIINPAIATVVITDDPSNSTIGFEDALFILEEGSVLQACVRVLVGSLERDVLVDITSNDGTATAGEDYSGVDQQLTFTMDEGRRCVNITLLEEDVLETTEIMFLDLQSEDPAVILSPAQASVFITDTSRITFGLENTVFQVDEEDGAFIEVCVVITKGELAMRVLVSLHTMDGTATSVGDFTALDVSIAFTSGQTRNCINVTILNDDMSEDPEQFFFILDAIDLKTDIDPDRRNGTVEITDDDDLRLGFIMEPYERRERDGFITLVVQVVGILDRDVRVALSTEDLTIPGNTSIPIARAIAGEDYTAITTVLTFGPAVTFNSINITLLDDDLTEGDELFQARLTILTPGTNIMFFPSDTALATILQEVEPRYRIGFETTAYTVSEDEGSLFVNVRLLSGVLVQPVALFVETVDGTATAPNDYIPLQQFLPFVGARSVEIFILNDAVSESDENFVVRLTPFDEIEGVIRPDRTTITITNVCSNGELRLRGGTSMLHGRVEICMSAVWGSICDNLWDDRDATVVCRQLGFSDQGAQALNRFGFLDFDPGPEESPIYLDDVQCRGDERRLDECVSDTNTEDCIHEFQDVGVNCQPNF